MGALVDASPYSNKEQANLQEILDLANGDFSDAEKAMKRVADLDPVNKAEMLCKTNMVSFRGQAKAVIEQIKGFDDPAHQVKVLTAPFVVMGLVRQNQAAAVMELINGFDNPADQVAVLTDEQGNVGYELCSYGQAEAVMELINGFDDPTNQIKALTENRLGAHLCFSGQGAAVMSLVEGLNDPANGVKVLAALLADVGLFQRRDPEMLDLFQIRDPEALDRLQNLSSVSSDVAQPALVVLEP